MIVNIVSLPSERGLTLVGGACCGACCWHPVSELVRRSRPCRHTHPCARDGSTISITARRQCTHLPWSSCGWIKFAVVLPFTSCLHVRSAARERRCLRPVRMTLLLAVGHRIRRHVNHSTGYLCHIGQFQPGLPLCASPHGVRAIALPRCVVHVVAAVPPSRSLSP